MNSQVIKQLNWRYATKKFDANKKLSQENIDTLLESISLAPTSYGLQPFEVLVVEDESLRAQLKEASWGQSQITDASQLIVFAAKTNFGNQDIEDFLELTSQVRNQPIDALKGYGDVMRGSLLNRSAEELTDWTMKQVYLALGVLLSSAAQLEIDACPMEGFNPQKYNEILGLSEKGLTATVVATVGYRAEEDAYQGAPKVRKAKSDLIKFI